jgi:dihydroorotate dehydrogenase
MHFRNPLGLAGGVDKTGQSLSSWQGLGAGFLEVGTVTPRPQGPNPGKIMDRDIPRQALWNKMGFPNKGVAVLKKRLQGFTNQSVPLFINIGKNRDTPNERAYEDYAFCIEELHPWADAFVINLSSPNTKGLRDLLSEKYLVEFLERLQEKRKRWAAATPVLLKLSPDMTLETLQMVLSRSSDWVDGWVLTNTTKRREPESSFPAHSGGVSGQPLRELSRQALQVAFPFKQRSPDKLLVSVGGIDTPEEVKIRLHAGADLVQVYTALVFQGPGFFHSVLSRLASMG